MLLLTLGTLFSCSEFMEEQEIGKDSIQVHFTYSLDQTKGSDMTRGTSSNSDVFNEFYEKMKTGDLVAPTYHITFTNIENGTTYTCDGKWTDNNILTMQAGCYNITGYSTATGNSIQDKCSIIFDEQKEISAKDNNVVLSGIYDCSLLIFGDNNIVSLSNFDGDTKTPFFSFNTYKYAFINKYLYNPSKKEDAYIIGEYTNGKTFKINTGDLNFIKGKYYAYSNIINDFNLPPMEDGNNADPRINLSIYETANSYIAEPNKQCYFNASVKGNSTTQIDNATSAIVVWETFNNSTTPNIGDVVTNVSYADGTISFETTDNCGNALIAVTDEDGIILWSWHIWVTDYNPELDYDVYLGFEDLKVMDRNLGAMSDRGREESFGFVYQWGRKDPFFAAIDYGTIAATATVTEVETSEYTGTDEFATNNPTTYILAYWQSEDWRQEHNNDAWSLTKTELDPCPPGWKTPSGDEFSIYHNLAYTTFDYENCGAYFTGANGIADIWMPAQGYHTDCFTDWWCLGDEARYWTTTTNAIYSHYFGFTSDNLGEITATYTDCSRANGHPIRCIQDK